jgi:signal transduction histidine kinase
VRLGITAALAVCAVAAAVGLNPRWAGRGLAAQAAVIGLLGGGGVALAAPLAVLIAAVRLPAWPAAAAIGSVTAALAAAAALTQHPAAQPGIAVTLFCVLLAVTGRFIRRNWESQDQTELLRAQLQDARDAGAAAAALAEHGRIAGELHDALAHALSGLAIQLQGARKLAGAEDASPGLRAAIARSADLAKEGLTQARQAAGALRGDRLPPVTQLPEPADGFRRDTGTTPAW